MELLGYTIWDKALPEDIGKYRVINTINSHSYEIAKNDASFNKALSESDMLLPDGIGIVWAAAFLRKKRLAKIAGTDLHFHMVAILEKKKGSCFYLGSSESTLSLIRDRIRREYPEINAGFYSPPYKESFTSEDNQRIVEAINNFHPDVLFVGMTAPKQEKWVYTHKEELNARVICSIGAVFDFFAGTVKRPGPLWIKTGLEFLPRLLKEPKRLWKRNLISTPLFLCDLLLFRLGILKDRNNASQHSTP